MKLIKSITFLLLLSSLNGCLFEEKQRESINLDLSPKQLYELAQQSIEAGTIDEAIKILERLQAAYPSSKYSIQAKLDIPYRLYKRERYDDAINSLNEFIKLYPNHFTTPYAYYLRGVVAHEKSSSILDQYNITDNAQRDVSSVKDSMNYFLALIDKFPNNKYSEEAKNKLIVLRNIIARHELFVAIYYTKNDAHIAAINRCKFIIEKFPNTPSVPAALHLIAHNYDIINAPKLAKDARRVLEASYPKYTPHYSLND